MCVMQVLRVNMCAGEQYGGNRTKKCECVHMRTRIYMHVCVL